MREKLDRKQRELVRLAEVEEDNHVQATVLPELNAPFRRLQDSFSGSVGGKTQEPADGPARASTPGGGGSNAHPDLGRFPGLRRRKAMLEADMGRLGEIV